MFTIVTIMNLLRIILIISVFCDLTLSTRTFASPSINTNTEDIFNISNEETSAISDNTEQSSSFKNCTRGRVIALNKVTATSEEILLDLEEGKYFGNIKIILHKCIKNLDPYNSDNYLLLTITEHKIEEDPILVFQGWMCSSSISFSTFTHPIYEVFVKDCE